MSCKIIWRKLRLYKRFELDIWGFHALAPVRRTKVTKLLVLWKKERRAYFLSKRMRYVYDLRFTKRRKFKKRMKRKFLTRKFTKLFYLTLSFRQFRNLALKAADMEGSFESNYLFLVEGRVITLLYRMHWMYNVFQMRQFIFNKNVLVNNKIITLCNVSLNLGDIIRLSSVEMTRKIRLDVIRRLSNKMFFFNVPRFLYVNYKLMFGIFCDEPLKKDLAYPIRNIDVYRGADIY